MEDMNKLMKQRREKLKKLRNSNIKAYAKKYKTTHYTKNIIDDFEKLKGEDVKVAGRLMAIRTHGKATFADLMDSNGKIQLFVSYNRVGEENYEFFNDLDIGDIVGVTGEVFKTNRGQISININEFVLLSKSLRPFPEKFHGLKDKDLRYRQRALDLIVNPEVKETFIKRSEIIREFRNFLEKKDFIEVETPMMHPIPGGASAKPFVTHHNALDMDLYLRIAPELYLKRLIVGGFEKVYEINRNFRNEGMSYKHNPEFTTMELYQAQADYHDMMDITEEIIVSTAKKVLGTTKIRYEEKEIDLTPPWPRMTMVESIKKYIDIDFDDIETDEEAQKIADDLDLEIDGEKTRGKIMNEVFEEKVEENLIQPTFIIDYPIEVSPLAKKHEDDPRMTYRFEAFINSWEIANAFTELNDPVEQRKRFEQQLRERDLGDEEAQVLDEDFVRALEYGMPPTGGLGIGIDRLVMILTDSNSIRDVILFPTMRPRQND
ncbi:MAG: lysine--tRNA ligase [Halanaerobiales bacterium]